jgi:hypothetical protein
MQIIPINEEFLLAKANALRNALIKSGVIVSPSPHTALAELPPERRERWVRLAKFYLSIFGPGDGPAAPTGEPLAYSYDHGHRGSSISVDLFLSPDAGDLKYVELRYGDCTDGHTISSDNGQFIAFMNADALRALRNELTTHLGD